MVNSVKPADYRQGVDEFLKAAKGGVEPGTKAFQKLVCDLGGNFQLAVMNVGQRAFDRVIGSEREIHPDEKAQYPNVAESIAKARADNPPVRALI